MLAGPPVSTSVLPSSFAGIGGAVRPIAAALARASAASKTNVAVVRGTTPYCAVAATDAGRVTLIAGRPVSAVAAARLATWCGFGCADQVSFPNCESWPSVWRSVGVTATAANCLASKIWRIESATPVIASVVATMTMPAAAASHFAGVANRNAGIARRAGPMSSCCAAAANRVSPASVSTGSGGMAKSFSLLSMLST
jgi:hypothetical protein